MTNECIHTQKINHYSITINSLATLLTFVKISRGRPQSDGISAANFSGGDWQGILAASTSISVISWESEPPVVGERGTSSPGSLGDGFGVAVAAGDEEHDSAHVNPFVTIASIQQQARHSANIYYTFWSHFIYFSYSYNFLDKSK